MKSHHKNHFKKFKIFLSCCIYFHFQCYNFSGEILPSDMRSTGSAMLGILQNVATFSAVRMIPVIISRFNYLLGS